EQKMLILVEMEAYITMKVLVVWAAQEPMPQPHTVLFLTITPMSNRAQIRVNILNLLQLTGNYR
ncbi:MAG: hypothetical protein ACJAZP_004139, partial [Psychromonas sp.]